MQLLILDLLPTYIPFLVQCVASSGAKINPSADNLIIYEEGGSDATFDSTQITGSPFDPTQINSKTGLWGVLVAKSAFTSGKTYIVLWEMTVDGVTTAKVEKFHACNAEDFKASGFATLTEIEESSVLAKELSLTHKRFPFGRVFIHSNFGAYDTVYPTGEAKYPVAMVSYAKTIANANNLVAFDVADYAEVETNMWGYTFYGKGIYNTEIRVGLNGRNFTVFDSWITGNGASLGACKDCFVGTDDYYTGGIFSNCILGDEWTGLIFGYIRLYDCIIPDGAEIDLGCEKTDWGSMTGGALSNTESDVMAIRLSGNFKITNSGVNAKVDLNLNGCVIEIDSTCSEPTNTWRFTGIGKVINNSTITNYEDLTIDADVVDIPTILSETQSHPTLSEIEASAVLAKEANVETHVTNSLNAYDSPTKAELDSAQAAIIAEVDANEVKIDTVDSIMDSIKSKTDNLPANPASSENVATVAGYVDTEIGTIITNLNTLLSRLSDTRAGYLDNLSDGKVSLQSYIDEVETLLKNGTYGLEAIKALVDELELSAGTTLVLPAMQANVVSSYITQGAHIKIKRGDGRTLPVQIDGDWSLWTARCGAKEIQAAEDYTIGPITASSGVYDAGTNTTLFNVVFTADDTDTVHEKLYAEVELTKTGSDPYTPLQFYLSIKQDIVRDIK